MYSLPSRPSAATTARPTASWATPAAAECATRPRCQGPAPSWAIAIRTSPASSRAASTIRSPLPICAAATRP
ncbi:hypothetical protein O1L68_25840 [Streptomyces lydicus]|nr:hypothetical protein [Streptomyces lydicus]